LVPPNVARIPIVISFTISHHAFPYLPHTCPHSAFNWPTVPDIREEPALEQLYTCLLVIYTTCETTLQKSYVWEKK